MGDFAGGNGLHTPRRMKFGPDGNLYVLHDLGDTTEVKRFNGKTGAFIDNFIPKGSGQLKPIGALEFGPDGNLYVATNNPPGIKRFDGKTGRFLGDLVTDGVGDMKAASNLIFRTIPVPTVKRK